MKQKKGINSVNTFFYNTQIFNKVYFVKELTYYYLQIILFLL